jgi:putative ABC transport system permease protein
MRWQKLVQSAGKSILKNRMRGFLTSLGIIIGVGAVIIMVAVGEGSQAEIEDRIKSLGADMIIVFPSASGAGGVSRGAGSMKSLTLEDSEELAQQSTLCRAVSPVVSVGSQVVGGVGNWFTTVSGVSPDYLTIRAWDLKSGEFFTERDGIARNKVCVLGQTVVDNLFPDHDPIGETIRIGNTPFKVCGVLEERGQSALGADEDDVILAPSTTVLYRLAGGTHVNMIVASAESTDMLEPAQEEIRTLLRDAHNLEPGQESDFLVRNQNEIIEVASASSEVMTLLLGAVASVSLIVGGIGIMNIMLVTVTERTREIGLRMALGARAKDVLCQFLAESVALSLVGGLVGITMSFTASWVLNSVFEIRAEVELWIVVVAFAFSGTVGVFFGLYPARKAANLDPIDALRYE